MSLSADFKYDLFISYSHADEALAAALEKLLSRFWRPGGIWPVRLPRRLRVFRDKGAAETARLNAALRNAIEGSGRLLVVCSPAARASHYVAAEIEMFAATGRGASIAAVLARGYPNDEALRRQLDAEAAFPDVLLQALNDIPWAPDLRSFDPTGKAKPARSEWLHLLALACGLSRDEVQRKLLKRRACQVILASLLLAATVYIGGRYVSQVRSEWSIHRAAESDAMRSINSPRALSLAIEARDTRELKMRFE